MAAQPLFILTGASGQLKPYSMLSQKESGHATNAGNVTVFLQQLAPFSSSYKPANLAIQLTALKTLGQAATDLLIKVETQHVNWKNATNAREILFKNLFNLLTKVVAELESVNMPAQSMDDVKAQVRKIRGGKLTKADAGKQSSPDSGQPDGPVSLTLHRSYSKKIELYRQLLLGLKVNPYYQPTDAALGLSSLEAKLAELEAANNAANDSWALLKAARMERNSFFYKDGTGLVSLMLQARAQVKAMFGSSSQQYKAIAKIKFRHVVPVKKAQ